MITSWIKNKNAAIFFLIFIGLYTLFIQNDKNGFDDSMHSFLSSHGLTIAKNLNIENKFLMFNTKKLSDKGEIHYDVYNRFPITSFLLIKIPLVLADGNFEKEIYFSKQLMNLFFIGSMILIYLSLYTLSKKNLLALCVTLATFSGYHLTINHDMVFNDIPAFFGFTLLFHGIATFLETKQEKQLLIKSMIAIAFGWQSIGLIAAFIAYGLFKVFSRKNQEKTQYMHIVWKLAIASGITTLVFLGSNILIDMKTNQKTLFETSTYQSLIKNAGIKAPEQYSDQKAYSDPVTFNINRMVKSTIPYSVGREFTEGVELLKGLLVQKKFILLLGLLLLFYVIILYKSPNKTPLFILFFGGQIWMLSMYDFTFNHEFQTIFLIGTSLLLFYPIFNYLNEKSNKFMTPVFIVTTAAFISSIYLANDDQKIGSEKLKLITNDFQTIVSQLKKPSSIYLDGEYFHFIGYGHAPGFYLSGHYITDHLEDAEYIVSDKKALNECVKTPQNKTYFLFCNHPVNT